MPTRPWNAIASSLALLLVAPAVGCVGVMGLSGCDVNWRTYDGERSTTIPAGEPVPLKVKTRNGSVKVVRTSGAETTVIAKIRAATPERLEDFVIDISKEDGGTLFVRPTPPEDEWKNGEGVSFEIRIPGTKGLQIETGNGSIEIAELSGEASLTTSNGAIRIDHHEGDVVARTSNGRIEAHELDGLIDGDTSNGRISVELGDRVTGPVRLDTSNGSISLVVGAAFAGEVFVDTSNGSITLDAPGATITKKRSSAKLSLPSPGGKTELDTSNGSITFRVRTSSGDLERDR